MDSFNNIIENSLPQVANEIPQVATPVLLNRFEELVGRGENIVVPLIGAVPAVLQESAVLAAQQAQQAAQQAIPAVAPAAVTGLFAWYRARRLPTQLALATGGLAVGGAAVVGIYKTGKVAVDYTIEAKDKVVEVVTDTTAKVGVIVENISNIPSKIITSTQETISEVTETASNTLKDLVLLGLVGVFIYTINSNSSSSSKRGNINIKYH